MVRSFQTHRIRPQTELSKLWTFTPLAPEYEGLELQVAVPSCWETYPNMGLYRGSGRYVTSFFGKGNIRVVLKGISHTGNVYLDGNPIASHYNAYTPFDGILCRQDNREHVLQIDVTNAFSEETSLNIPNDYMTYGGINRPVVIEEVPDVFIEWVHAMPVRAGNAWKLMIETKLKNISASKQSVALHHQLNGAALKGDSVDVAQHASKIVKSELMCSDIETYTTENPKLYELETLLYADNAEAIDDLIERVGFRTIRTEGNKILLNDEPLVIKGICRHEDHPQFACALPFQAMDYDLNLIKDLGANAIRTTHYPNDELFLDLCDEKGILVWEENHARALTEEQMRNPHFRPQCSDCTREMIEHHFNHPSIIIWGILNECASETEYGKQCYAEQFALIKNLDSSRPTSFSSCKFFTDISLGLPDIVSYNVYPEWYSYDEWNGVASTEKIFTDLYDWVQKSTEGAGKPFLITEIGGGAIYGNHNPYKSKWSEERQAEILSLQLPYLFGREECSGVFIWQYCDVRVSEEWFYSRPRTMNNKGIVDEYRRPKLSYQTVKSILHAQHKP